MRKERLPILHIDFSRLPEESIDEIWPLTDASMSNSLPSEWSAAEVRRVNTQHGLYTDIPLLCIGRDKCPYGKYCKFENSVIENHFIDKNCPIEVLEAYKLFAGYVIDLNISPNDFTDIQTVADLVRLHILLKRCDLYQKDKPIYDETVGGVVQKTGEAKVNRVANLGFEMSIKIRNDISKKYDQLIASRDKKLKAQATQGKAISDVANLMSHLTALASQEDLENN